MFIWVTWKVILLTCMSGFQVTFQGATFLYFILTLLLLLSTI